MKAVMLSLRPEWCEKIFNGEKTIEIRRTRPSIPTPFKVMVYETKGATDTPWVDEDGHFIYKGRGEVIGSFVCNRTTCCQAYYDDSGKKHLTNLFGVDTSKICLSELEIFDYIIGKDKKDGIGWLWHISDLKIYDKPKELGEFRKPCNHINDCCTCKEAEFQYDGDELRGLICRREIPLTRPPQSWVYCEPIEEE